MLQSISGQSVSRFFRYWDAFCTVYTHTHTLNKRLKTNIFNSLKNQKQHRQRLNVASNGKWQTDEACANTRGANGADNKESLSAHLLLSIRAKKKTKNFPVAKKNRFGTFRKIKKHPRTYIYVARLGRTKQNDCKTKAEDEDWMQQPTAETKCVTNKTINGNKYDQSMFNSSPQTAQIVCVFVCVELIESLLNRGVYVLRFIRLN